MCLNYNWPYHLDDVTANNHHFAFAVQTMLWRKSQIDKLRDFISKWKWKEHFICFNGKWKLEVYFIYRLTDTFGMQRKFSAIFIIESALEMWSSILFMLETDGFWHICLFCCLDRFSLHSVQLHKCCSIQQSIFDNGRVNTFTVDCTHNMMNQSIRRITRINAQFKYVAIGH